MFEVSDNQNYKCFIIHLKRAQNRKPYVDDIISKLNMNGEEVSIDLKNSGTKHFKPVITFEFFCGSVTPIITCTGFVVS